MTSIAELAANVLRAASSEDKIKTGFEMQAKWMAAPVIDDWAIAAPDRPARPAQPELVPPADVPRRRLGSPEGRAALLHAVAHIEFNAINLAADMILRFGRYEGFETASDRHQFITDWVSVAHDECRHFEMLRNYLIELGYDYGSFPAHDGLWEAAQQTSHDIAARLAIAPAMIEKFKKVSDLRSAEILTIIYEEEVAHVKFGTDWFNYFATQRGKNSKDYFHEQVQMYFKGVLKRPFNDIARLKAGLEPDFYLPLAI